MKPLTIEELKALEVGDWVWVVGLESGHGYYRCIAPSKYGETAYSLREAFLWCANDVMLSMKNYGKTWIAYNNKQEAEAKGEIVDTENTFCCSMIGTTERGEKYVSLEDYEHDIKKLGNVIKAYKKRLENGELIDTTKYFTKKERKLDGSCRYLICKYDVSEGIYDFCDTLAEAERRLAELGGK